MEKGKRVEAEFQLPEAIIQHIQSFLNGKESAQTTLLSKSWNDAWLTRPNLHFDQKEFERESSDDGTESSENRFWNFVNKTVERYDKLNLKIESLRLWILRSDNANYQYDYSLVNKLIMKALKMGATCLDFKIHRNDWRFTLPQQVFGSENLVILSVNGCKICMGVDGKVSCSRLKSLTVDMVYVEGDIIWDIISTCSLIENLSLSIFNEMALIPRSMFGKQNVGLVLDKLKCLLLSEINVDTLFFDDFSSKFPCLKDLSVHRCGGYKGIKVSSPSLECISFKRDKILRAKFDVPSIRKFTFSGPIPSLSFKTSTSNWESDISIRCWRYPSVTWVLNLNKLLTKLSLSKVFLSLHVYSGKGFDCAEDIKGLPKPQVENLTINSFCSDLFDVLFRCCRPIYVTQQWFPNVRMRNNDFMKFIYKRVMQEVSLKCCECDLEEVDVEFFDEVVSAWRPRLLDASTTPGADTQIIRLHLRWGR
ncbi:hypothetical protein ACS0TY_012378 [Phlomoides rotata]